LKAKVPGEEIEEYDPEHSIEVQGGINIFGGETERAHNEIKQEIQQIAPNVKVITRWHYGVWSWENEYGEDEDEDCARLKVPEDFEEPEVDN